MSARRAQLAALLVLGGAALVGAGLGLRWLYRWSSTATGNVNFPPPWLWWRLYQLSRAAELLSEADAGRLHTPEEIETRRQLIARYGIVPPEPVRNVDPAPGVNLPWADEFGEYRDPFGRNEAGVSNATE